MWNSYCRASSGLDQCLLLADVFVPWFSPIAVAARAVAGLSFFIAVRLIRVTEDTESELNQAVSSTFVQRLFFICMLLC